MKNILFIQGAGEGAHSEDQDLASYLEAALGPEYVVRYPLFSGLENVVYESFKNELKAELEKFKEPFVVITHSLGGAAFLKYLSEEKLDTSIIGMYLIATPYKCKDGEWASDDFALETDFASALPDVNMIFMYHSKDDEWVPFSHLSRWVEKLPNSMARHFEDRGHSFSQISFVELVQDVQTVAETV